MVFVDFFVGVVVGTIFVGFMYWRIRVANEERRKMNNSKPKEVPEDYDIGV